MASPQSGSVTADHATVHTVVDHRGVTAYRFEFPKGPWRLGDIGYDALMRDGLATRRGNILTLQGRRFVLVPYAHAWQLPGHDCYPVNDWRTWIALVRYRALRVVDPLRMWLAFQCYYFGAIKMGDAVGWSDIARIVFVGNGDDTPGF